jgi:hypothetical protein
MSTTVTCQHCGAQDKYRTETKANNLVAYCTDCGKYIKNLPHAEPALYVGRYKGKPIKEIYDIQYLQWAETTLKLTSTVKTAVLTQISFLQNQAR